MHGQLGGTLSMVIKLVILQTILSLVIRVTQQIISGVFIITIGTGYTFTLLIQECNFAPTIKCILWVQLQTLLHATAIRLFLRLWTILLTLFL